MILAACGTYTEGSAQCRPNTGATVGVIIVAVLLAALLAWFLWPANDEDE